LFKNIVVDFILGTWSGSILARDTLWSPYRNARKAAIDWISTLRKPSDIAQNGGAPAKAFPITAQI
jgi:hypothetical protein